MFEDASELAAEMSSFVPQHDRRRAIQIFLGLTVKSSAPARSGETSVVAYWTQLGRKSHWPRSSGRLIPVRLPVYKTHCPGLSSS